MFTESWKHSSRIVGQIDELHRHFVGTVSSVESDVFFVEKDNLSSAWCIFAVCDKRANRWFFLLEKISCYRFVISRTLFVYLTTSTGLQCWRLAHLDVDEQSALATLFHEVLDQIHLLLRVHDAFFGLFRSNRHDMVRQVVANTLVHWADALFALLSFSLELCGAFLDELNTTS